MIRKPNLTKEYLLRFKDEFLKMNNLKIGDSILWEFQKQSLHQAYNRREMNRVTFYEKSKGVLKEDENGLLYTESLKDFKFYKSKLVKGKTTYVGETRKSIHYFGEGFISKHKI